MIVRYWMWLFGFSIVVLAGCGSRADFTVVRPPEIDYEAYENGHAVELGDFTNASSDSRGGQLAQLVRRELQNAGAYALGVDKDLEIVDSGGGLVIDGQVTRLEVTQEEEEEQASCNYREDGQERQAACTHVTLRAEVVSDVLMEVHAADGSLVHSSTVSDSARTSSFGTTSSVGVVNNPPDPININDLISEVGVGIAATYAHVVFPWEQSVRVRFSRCFHDDLCDEAVDLAQNGYLVEADEAFTELLAPYEDAGAEIPDDQLELVANAFRNRALVRRYSEDYENALADMERALRLNPSEMDWREEMEGILVEQSGGAAEDQRETPRGLGEILFEE